jgi:hypothetical protein
MKIRLISLLKEINGYITAIVVNATDFKYITAINPTESQMTDIQSNGTMRLDTCPLMQLRLKLRGPKGQN